MPKIRFLARRRSDILRLFCSLWFNPTPYSAAAENLPKPVIMKINFSKCFLATALLAVAAVSANAQTTFYDGFVIDTPPAGYTVGTLSGQNPTIPGFNGAWANGGPQQVVAAGLDYAGADYYSETGGSVFAGPGSFGRTGRSLSTPVTAATTGTLYLSFLMQTPQADGNGYRAFELHNTTFDDSNRKFQLGFQNFDFASNTTNYGFNASGSGGPGATQLGVNNGGVNLFVVRFTLSSTAASDSITVWQNPTSEVGGVTQSGLNVTFDRVTFAAFGTGAGDNTNWDELRIGDSFAAVAIVPEPSTYAMVLGGVGMLIGFRRRSCRS
jgi:hypothetical protein